LSPSITNKVVVHLQKDSIQLSIRQKKGRCQQLSPGETVRINRWRQGNMLCTCFSRKARTVPPIPAWETIPVCCKIQPY